MAELVSIQHYISDAIIDLRYTKLNNVTGQKISDQKDAMIDKIVINKLIESANTFRKMGLRLVILDSFRTNQTQEKLKQFNNDNRYVADKSNHCLGIALDITLSDQKGNLLDMGSDFDDFSTKSWPESNNINDMQKQNREILKKVMVSNDFTQNNFEWWHFDYDQD